MPKLKWGTTWIVIAVALVILFRNFAGTAPEQRRPPPLERESWSLPQDAPGAEGLPEAYRRAPLYDLAPGGPAGNSVGTAFAVGEGLWLTAQHVVEHCDSGYLLPRADPTRATPIAAVTVHRSADVAVLRLAASADSLPVREQAPLEAGEPGYAFGFPAGEPGAVRGTLIGPIRFRRGDRGTVEPSDAWAESERRPAGLDSLGGLSGSPLLDGGGGVIGVVSAESARRGRFYSAPLSAAWQLLEPDGSAPRPSAARPLRLDAQSFWRTGEELRARESVSLVYCRVD